MNAIWYAILAVATLAAGAAAPLHAFFDLDDYRYLLEVRQIDAGEPHAWLNALVVENRWDDAWWLPSGTVVRFFRPLVAPSYWLDAHVWGQAPVGYAITNVVLHLTATLLLYKCLLLIVGRRWPAWIAALAFGVHAVHWENLGYVAGRTDTIAAIPFLAAIIAFRQPRPAAAVDRPAWRRAVLPSLAFFVAMLGKEYSVVLPLLLLLLDWLQPSDGVRRAPVEVVRRNGPLLAGCAAALAVYLVLRRATLGELGSGVHPYPYFFFPGHPGFAARTGAALLQYAGGLALGEFVMPFLGAPADLKGDVVALAFALLWVCGLMVWGWRRREGQWFVLLFVTTLLPMLVLYTSGRYLYLPSAGYCALLGLAIERSAVAGVGWLQRRLLPTVIAVLFVVVPGVRLADTSARIPSQYRFGLQRAALRSFGDVPLQAGRRTFLLDFPGDWFERQFAAGALAVAQGGPPPALAYLTARDPARSGAPALVARPVDARTVELWRGGAPLIHYDAVHDFEPAPLPPGARVVRPGFAVTVLEAIGGQPTRARVELLDDAFFYAFPPATLQRQ
jgi:hypothetical protein